MQQMRLYYRCLESATNRNQCTVQPSIIGCDKKDGAKKKKKKSWSKNPLKNHIAMWKLMNYKQIVIIWK